jgi:ribonuclease PH
VRADGREAGDLRLCRIVMGAQKYAEGSCIIQLGDTRVLCAASVDERVPPWLIGAGEGWVTGEYSMLPRSTRDRSPREAATGRLGGRTQEIQRLIGRSLRAVVDQAALGERTVTVDCDVIQADGGTRTAAVTGGFVALAAALAKLQDDGIVKRKPLLDQVAAVSVGLVGGELMLDLAYDEDRRAAVDMNVVATGRGGLVEVQGTAEGAPFSPDQLQQMLALAQQGIAQLLDTQRTALGDRLRL